MGCAGSKPHMLLSSSNGANGNHNLNSPQKGFILFNAKTIEYLIANEADTKQKLIQRCQPKLLKPITAATMSKSSSVGGGAKKAILSANTPEHKTDDNLELASSSPTTTVDTSKQNKEAAIDAAVDYVLKYAINDFDIEDFKSSNHLSMKQIRKDIMKKSNSSRVSHSKLNNNNTNSANTSNGNNGTTLSKQPYDLAFYKLALNTAIDEFGSFVQENFIVINEFASKLEDEQQQKASVNTTLKAENSGVKREGTPESVDDEEALKLKEALELARQNFYKGKMSMVCLAKHGGYVVKEVNDRETLAATSHENNTSNNNDDTIVCSVADIVASVDSNESKKEAAITDKTPKINIDDFDHASRSIDESNKVLSKTAPIVSKMPIDEFLSIKNDLTTVLSQTGESIVNYSTKSAIYNESSHLNEMDESKKLFDSTKGCADTLLENLEKSKNIIEILNIINEKDYNLIDEKLIESTLNLDYVNREFQAYLVLLEDNLKQEKEKFQSSSEQAERFREIFDKNTEIKNCVSQLSKLVQSLPCQLFISKGFPHPSDVNHSLSITSLNTSDFSKDLEELVLNRDKNTMGTTTEIKQIENAQTETESDEKISSSQTTTSTIVPIDIKKEIAFSILNMGEVIAKTIDYYSLESTDAHSEDLKELIKMSDDQAALEKKLSESKTNSRENLPTSLLHVSISNVNSQDENSKKDERMEQLQTPEGSASSLSSPSMGGSSSSPMSASGSISPIISKSNNNNDESMKILSSPSSRHQEYELIEKVKSTAFTEHVKPSSSKNSIRDDLAYLAEEINVNEHFECSQVKNSDASNYGAEENRLYNESDRAKSSSSSSDILSSNNDDLETQPSRKNQVNVEESSSQMIVEQFIASTFIENIIENASDRYTNEPNDQSVVFRKQSITNNENLTRKKDVDDNNKVKRMSLDEEIFYRLEEVDKKVKYMNETCSENEDDLDDLDDENFDYDESVEIENGNDERLFHPRTPAKIKSEVRSNPRAINLQEEIKQISNVIQDLVQTINVRNGSKTSINNEGLTDDETCKINNHINGGISSFEDSNNNADSEDCGSQNSGSGGDCKSKSNGNDKRGSNNKRHSTGIPVRKNSQKSINKQNSSSTLQSEELANDKALKNELIEEISIENTKIVTSPESGLNINRHSASKITSQKSRSKLPVRK